MAIQAGPATSAEKELKTNWPVEDGLEAGTTRQTGRISNLVPINSVVMQEERTGLNNG